MTASQARTTPEVLFEIQLSGATGRRLEHLLAAGLGVESPAAMHAKAVERMAKEAGSEGRLSDADRSVLALALQYRDHASLLSDDYTVLDLARRLGVHAEPVSKAGITSTQDWRVRCAGCGRHFTDRKAGQPCPICGSELRLKPRRN